MEENDDIKKKQELLVSIILSRGYMELDAFGYDNEARENFLKEFGLLDLSNEIDDKFIQLGRTSDITTRDRLKQEIASLKNDACERCRECLKNQGVDVDEVVGKHMSWDELKEQLAKQLEENFGISRGNAEKSGLLDEDVITRGTKNEFIMDDTVERRKKLKEAGIPFKAEDGKIRLEMELRAQQGVCYDDTPQNRRILDENEMEYIEMAQGNNLRTNGKNVLFVPFNWLNAADKGYNSKLARTVLRGSKVAIAGTLLGPAGAVLLLAYYKCKQHLINEKAHNLSLAERKALKHGLTVYKENKDKYGRTQPMYYYQKDGKTYSVGAHDVRIPDKVKGIRLSPVDKERLRRGELVELKDAKGKEFGIRIDINRPNILQEYYRENKRDKNMKEVPGSSSSDKEKLEWIASHGAEGITQIFSDKHMNLERDVFLSQYGMRQLYMQFRMSKIEMEKSTDETRKQGAKESIHEADAALKDIAESEIAKLGRKMGR